MVIIGLCGNSGSGKGTVSRFFGKYGIPSIDADAVYHDLTNKDSELNRNLAAKFGIHVLNDDFSLNRRALAEVVFSDKSGNLLKDLNKMTHSWVISATEERIKALTENGEKAVVFDAPLLFESGYNEKCDIIITVTASKEDKIKRIIKRDSIDESKALDRINSQLSEEFLVEHSDYVISNFGSVDDVDEQVKKIINNIFNSEV